ncbi:MAG: helix-turn-helix domain-containing protein, partial [Mailhella sp.]|nr:helix-turn-helix domain-containing protein [Mailhella sp.]
GERFSLSLKRLNIPIKNICSYIDISEYQLKQIEKSTDENYYKYINDYILEKLKELGFNIEFLLYEVIPYYHENKSIAFRLKQERKRRKFSLNYIEKNTFISHSRLSRIENNLNIKNEKILTSWDLTRLAEIGLDVQYILFGIRAENALLDEEKELIRHFRGCKNKDLKWYAHAALCADDCNELQKIVNFNNNKNIYNVKIKN